MEGKHFSNLGLEFGDYILVSAPNAGIPANTLGIFLAFQGDFLVWVGNVGGALRLLNTSLDSITIASAL